MVIGLNKVEKRAIDARYFGRDVDENMNSSYKRLLEEYPIAPVRPPAYNAPKPYIPPTPKLVAPKPAPKPAPTFAVKYPVTKPVITPPKRPYEPTVFRPVVKEPIKAPVVKEVVKNPAPPRVIVPPKKITKDRPLLILEDTPPRTFIKTPQPPKPATRNPAEKPTVKPSLDSSARLRLAKAKAKARIRKIKLLSI